MKKKFKIDWLSILLILTFFINLIIHVVLYTKDKKVVDLIQSIIFLLCLLVYFIILLLASRYSSKKYFIVYGDYFLVNGINIIKESKLVSTRKTNRYKKYSINFDVEKKYIYSKGEDLIGFKLVELDQYRKLMIINKTKLAVEDLYRIFTFDKEKMVEHYYLNNSIEVFDGDSIFKINKRNIVQIKELNGKYIVLRYRHYVPIEISLLKQINENNVGWKYIGDSAKDGIDYFETYEEAEEYVSFLK